VVNLFFEQIMLLEYTLQVCSVYKIFGVPNFAVNRIGFSIY